MKGSHASKYFATTVFAEWQHAFTAAVAKTMMPRKHSPIVTITSSSAAVAVVSVFVVVAVAEEHLHPQYHVCSISIPYLDP